MSLSMYKCESSLPIIVDTSIWFVDRSLIIVHSSVLVSVNTNAHGFISLLLTRPFLNDASFYFSQLCSRQPKTTDPD